MIWNLPNLEIQLTYQKLQSKISGMIMNNWIMNKCFHNAPVRSNLNFVGKIDINTAATNTQLTNATFW